MDKYAQIYRDSAIPIILVSMQNLILELNNSAAVLLGYSKQELIHQDVSIIDYPGEDPNPEVVKDILLHNIGKKLEVEKRMVQKNGNVIWVKLLVSVIQDDVDNEPFFMAVIEDISDSIIIYNQRKYDTLRRNERILRKAIETTAVQILLIDLDGKIIYTNNTFPGVDKEELVGTNYFNICQRDLIEVIKVNMLLVASTKNAVQYENSFVDEIGQMRHMHNDMSAAYSGNEVIGVSIVSTDIAVVKHLEVKLKEIERLLFEALNTSRANMTILDLNGIVIYVNNVVPGIDKDEYIGSIVYDYLPADLSIKVKQNMSTVVATKEPIQFQTTFIDPLKQTHYYVHDMSPIILNGEVNRISIVSNELETSQSKL